MASLNAIKISKKTKTEEPIHPDSMDSSQHMREISPKTNGPLSSFYSAGPVLSLEGLIQPKLTIGQPNDIYEQEADRVADRVMSMPEPKGALVNGQWSLGEKESSLVQRKAGCPECEEEKEQIQTKPLAEQIAPLIQRQCEIPNEDEEEEEEKSISRKTSGSCGGSTDISSCVDSHISALKGKGQPLSPSTRDYFEPRFGSDFSNVRVHASSDAAAIATEINAKAFTNGKDIVFGIGQYSPGTSTGKRLLAHELTHVIQQRKDHLSGLQKAPAPCKKTILAEGTCEFLALNTKWVCCDPDKGFSRPGKTISKAEPDKTCKDAKWTPLFTCDSKCKNQLEKRCDDNDNWMALPNKKFASRKCGDIYTICANGRQTEGYVRDKSEKPMYEVSPGIQKALGVTVGAKFMGKVYPPNTAKDIIDKNSCCKAKQLEQD